MAESALRAINLLLLLLAAAAQSTVEYSNSFENGNFITSPAGSSERGINSSCTGATATVSSAVPTHSGTYAAVLTVKTACANWRLKFQTRDWNMTTDKSYAVCMWVKSNYTTKPFLPTVAFSWYKKDGTLLEAVQPRITSEWAKYCYYVHKVPADGLYYFNLNVGAAAANTAYYIDDVTLTSEPNLVYDNWMATATARIEQLRKGDLSLDLRYSDGSQVPSAALQGLSVTLKKHDFPFGVAYSPENFAKSAVTQKAFYNSKAGSLFNAMVPENAFKWPYYEPTMNNRAAGMALLNQFYNFTATNDFQFMRQHTIEWFLNDAEFTRHWSRKGDCTQYATYLKTRIEREVAAFPGVVKSLDVFNEIMTRRAYAETCNLFAGGPSSVIVQAFKWANAVKPDLKLCLNDFDLISSDRWINFVEMIEWLRSNGAPVHCIGAQSHLGPQDIVPDLLAYRIDKMSSLLNIPVEMSEISFHTFEDPNTWQQTMTDEAAQADAFEKMLTTYFSHPKVTALLLWGFVDTNHYIPSGGIYRADGTPKPAGVVVEQLITSTWNSSSPAVPVSISPAGLPTFRGFYGRYDVSASIAVTPGTTVDAVAQRVEFPSSAGPAQTVVVTLAVPPPSVGGRRLLRGA